MYYGSQQGIYCEASVNQICFSSFSDAPRVELALGKSISPGSIYEGGDVYFDCLVDASPKPHKILWFQDVSNYFKTTEGSEMIQGLKFHVTGLI